MSRMVGRLEGDQIVFELRASNRESAAVALDTGFTGELALSPETATRLGFGRPIRSDLAELADGSMASFDVAVGTVIWLGKRRTTRALLVDTDQGSLGMGMLRDVIVHIDTHAGVASIDRAV